VGQGALLVKNGEADLARFVLFFDRREWSSGTLAIEAESEEEALSLYQAAKLDDDLERITWDSPDDTKVTLISIEPPKTRVIGRR